MLRVLVLYVSMSIGPTLLRAFLLGVASFVPENSPLDSVVFRSSLQILIGVLYVVVFYIVSACVRILVGKQALMDPTESVNTQRYNVRYDVEDLYNYGENQGHDEQSSSRDVIHDAQPPSTEGLSKEAGGVDEGVRGHSTSTSVASGSATILVRVGRDMERRVGHIVPKLKRVVNTISAAVKDDVTAVDSSHLLRGHSTTPVDHSPAGRGSVDAHFSDDSSDQDSTEGVHMREQQKVVSRLEQGAHVEPNDHTVTFPDTPRDNSRPPFPMRGYRGGVYESTQPPPIPGSDRIYTDVYGLGFAAFVLHYTMDCSSMQPTMFLLIGLTVIGARDVSTIATSVADNLLPQATLFTRALTVFAFILLVTAQICMVVGIVRVPTYHTDARDGSITQIPSPETILEHLLARFLPILAPFALYMVSKKAAVVSDVTKTLRRAMPTTVLIAMWFITCFGAMSDQIRNAVGAISVNATVIELSETDVALNMQLPLLVLSPFVKIPALIAIVSCCLTRKTMDVVSTLCVLFYAKQLHVVRDLELIQMLNVSFMCACLAWFSLTLRYCTPAVHAVANLFDNSQTV